MPTASSILFSAFLFSAVDAATDCSYSASLLSYTFSHRARVIPNYEPFIITPEEDLLDILLLPLNITVKRYFSSDEVATHVDVSGRFHADGGRVGEMPFCDLFLVPAIKFDLTSKALRCDNFEVTVADLEEWICEHGPLPPRHGQVIFYLRTSSDSRSRKVVVPSFSTCRFIAIFDFGWSDRYDDARRYFGDDTILDLLLPLQYSWPGLSLEAAEFLVQCSAQCVAVGVDSPGVDTGYRTSLAESIPPLNSVSRYLTRYGVYLIENLQLRGVELPARGFFLTVGLINLQVGTAAPAYVVAEYCADPAPRLACPAQTLTSILVPRHY